jgi:hypothetical protein
MSPECFRGSIGRTLQKADYGSNIKTSREVAMERGFLAG